MQGNIDVTLLYSELMEDLEVERNMEGLEIVRIGKDPGLMTLSRRL